MGLAKEAERAVLDDTLGGMRRVLSALLAALASVMLLMGLTSCASSQGTQQTQSGVQVVGVDEFDKVATSPGVKIIDVRTPAEFASGHIPGAVNIDVAQPGFDQAIAALDESQRYAVYCRTGNRSRAAAQQMSDAGFTSVVDLDGGIVAWSAAGRPVE